MPVVCLKYKRKPWVVKYREPWSGKPRQRAFADEAKARAFEEAQAAIYERERAIVKAVRRRRTQGRPTSPTVAELLSRYLESLGNPSTRAASSYHLRLFGDIFGLRKAHCLGVEEVGAFLTLQQQRGVGKSTACRRIGIVRAAYNWGSALGAAAHQPAGRLEAGQSGPANAGPAHGPRGPPALHGSRAACSPSHCSGYGHGVHASVPANFSGSAGRISTPVLPLCACQCRQGRAGRSPRGAVAGRTCCVCCCVGKKKMRPTAANGSSITKDAACAASARAWRNTLRRAGIERRIRPYDLRHAFASRALDNDADLKCVAEIMGHANEKMIVRFYRHTSARQRRKAVNAAPPLGLE